LVKRVACRREYRWDRPGDLSGNGFVAGRVVSEIRAVEGYLLKWARFTFLGFWSKLVWRRMSSTSNNPVCSLNIAQVLDGTGGRRGISLFPLLLLAMVLIMTATAGGSSALAQGVVSVLMAGVILFTLVRAKRMAAQQRREQEFLREVDEEIRLGRWFQAGYRLVQVLGMPGVRPHVRFQTLIYLGSVLNYEGRYEEVEKVYNYLLQNPQLPPPIAFSMQCARAYAILRQDRLTDAYEAISRLRRGGAPADSAMLTLLEMYRQVMTGHHEDALELFESRRTVLAQQLGHRSSDGWALAAAAADHLGKQEQAETMARNALLLGRAEEISRRFPECSAILERVRAARAVEGAVE
jgi:hypothetical protein